MAEKHERFEGISPPARQPVQTLDVWGRNIGDRKEPPEQEPSPGKFLKVTKEFCLGCRMTTCQRNTRLTRKFKVPRKLVKAFAFILIPQRLWQVCERTAILFETICELNIVSAPQISNITSH